MLPRNVAYNRQAQAAPRFPVGIAAIEAPEYLSVLAFRNARPGVVYSERTSSAGVGPDRNRNPAFLGRIADCILNKIAHQRLQLGCIAVRRLIAVGIEFKGNMMIFGVGITFTDNPPRDFGQIHGGKTGKGLVRFSPCGRKQLLYQPVGTCYTGT